MPTLVESDLLNRVKDNEELFDENISTNCISSFLSPNSSSKMSHLLPGGGEDKVKKSFFLTTRRFLR